MTTTLVSVIKSFESVLTKNSPAILTGIGAAGTVTTAYLAGKASFAAARVIDAVEYEEGMAEEPLQRFKERAGVTWRLYIPAGMAGALTIGCIIAGARISHKRTAAAYSLVALTDAAFGEYKDKVVEKIGEKKEKELRDELAQDRVNKNPPSGQVVIASGESAIFCELFTGRYFNCNVETIRKAEIKINQKILRENEATLNDFYYEIGLEPTSYSERVGWDLGRMLEISFSATVTPNEKACMAFEYSHTKEL